MNLFLAQTVFTSSYQTTNHVPPGLLIAVGCGVLVVSLAIQAVILWFVSNAFAQVPPEYRQNMTPGQVWLLLIPLFNLVWNFFVYQRISDSFRAYFEATGRPQPGDYGKQLGLIYSILVCCCFIPCVGYAAGLAALVLLIILIVKFVGYKNLIISGGGQGSPVEPPRPPQ